MKLIQIFFDTDETFELSLNCKKLTIINYFPYVICYNCFQLAIGTLAKRILGALLEELSKDVTDKNLPVATKHATVVITCVFGFALLYVDRNLICIWLHF